MENEEDIHSECLSSSDRTPLRKDAFDLSDEEKMVKIEKNIKEIMETLGLDLTDDSLKRTPNRVAKMYITETFSGLNPANKPKITLFDNKYKYNQMLVEKDINVFTVCEHHLVPFYGKCHVAYISNGQVIGLSKINRTVQYFCNRPQVQERLTKQIANDLRTLLGTEDVAVVIDAVHMCVSSRGIRDTNSSTITASISGAFENAATRSEFLRYIGK